MNILNKVKTHLKSAVKYAEENKKAVIKLLGMAAGIIVCSVLMLTLFTSAYEVYIDGEKVAVVADKAVFEKGFNKANDLISEIAGEEYKVKRNPQYVVTVSAKAWLTDETEITRNVMAKSSGVAEVCYIVVDGKEIATAPTKLEAEELIKLATETYDGETSKILNKIEFTDGFESVINICSKNGAVDKLLDVLRVQTEKTEIYKEDIVCTSERKPTDTLYVNEEKIVKEGQNGIVEVMAKVTEINGIATNVTPITKKVIKEPTTEIVMVGTKEIPSVGTGIFTNPFYGTITSRFGARWGRRHTGIDICGEVGSPIKSADNGIVITAEYQENGYGNIIIIDHQNGVHTWYAHLHKINVKVGDVVKKGTAIGELGNTGYSTGPHLHFEVRENGTPVNPSKYVDELK